MIAVATSILAVDPGGTTGWAWWRSDTHQFESGEASDWKAWLYDRPDYDILVIEKYTITAKTAKLSQQTDALRLTGALEMDAYPHHRVIITTPAEAKSFSNDGKLKRVGWYRPGNGHANDAARHLLLTAVRRGLIDPAIFLED